ncbi:MAG TPA: helix-turn-helix domain-containing protein [Pseudonocardia sp.]|jgi:excisionase family DNA binding protein
MVTVSGRVAQILLTVGRLAEYRRVHAGEDPEVDGVLLRLTLAGRRYQLGPVPCSVQPDPPDSDTGDDRQVSTAEAAAAIGVDPSTIGRAIRRGDLRAVLIGGRYAIRTGDLARYAARRADTTE